MKCKVCGHEFELNKENRYTSIREENQLITGTIFREYDCFDCPKCGCQNMVNERIERYSVMTNLPENFDETT